MEVLHARCDLRCDDTGLAEAAHAIACRITLQIGEPTPPCLPVPCETPGLQPCTERPAGLLVKVLRKPG